MADNSDLMQMFKDAIQRSANARYRSGAQSAIGQANAIGGVYGHTVQADTAAAGQNIQAKAEEDRNVIATGTLGLAKKTDARLDASPSESLTQAVNRLLKGNTVGGVGGQGIPPKNPLLDWTHFDPYAKELGG